MKFTSASASLAAMVTTTMASGVIVPLYVWPGDVGTCAGWAPLISAITTHISTQFYIVVNPSSGPGANGTQPSDEYQSCTTQLKSAGSNVKVLGYIPTTGGARSTSDIMLDINTYAGWSSAYRPVGVFYDEVDTSSTYYSTYSSWASSARSAFNGGSGYVILNPGVTVSDTNFYAIADQIVSAEKYYSSFSASSLSITSSSPAAKQAVILHDAPSALPTSLINALAGTYHIGSLYITDDVQAGGNNPYDALPTYLSSFVTTVANAS